MGIRRLIGFAVALLLVVSVHAADEGGGEVRCDVIYKRVGQKSLGLDLHYPATTVPKTGYPLVVFIHGGGWSKGNKTIGEKGVRFLGVQALNEAGFCVASVDYRLCTQDGAITIRECVIDCMDAVRYLAMQAAELSLDANHVFTIGDSAGGHLAQMVLLSPPASFPGGPALADADFRLVAGVSWYGPCDFEKSELFRRPDGTGDAERFMNRLLRGDEGAEEKLATIRELSPVNYLKADMPPLLMLQGDQDPTIPVHHARYMKKRAEAVKAPVEVVIIENASHGWKGIDGKPHPDLDEIIGKTVGFMQRRVEPGPVKPST